MPKVGASSKEWNLANKSDNRVKQLEDALCQEHEVVATLDAKILNQKKEIQVFQLKVQEDESEKKKITKVNQQQIDAEFLVGIQHIQTVNTLDVEIEGFTSIISQVDRRLYVVKIQYDRLKSSFLSSTCIFILCVNIFMSFE